MDHFQGVRRLFGLSISFSILTPLLQAQMCPMGPTLNYVVDSADRVVVGRVAEIGKTTESRKNAETPVSVDVDLTLTGDKTPEIVVPFPKEGWPYMFSQAPMEMLHGWETNKDKLLLALTQYSGRWYVTMAFDLDRGGEEMVSSEFKVLKTGAEVLRATREEAAWLNSPAGESVRQQKKTRKTPTSDWNAFDNGRLESFITGCDNRQPSLRGTKFVNESLILPADERLEKNAHAALAGRTEPMGLSQGEAIFALRHFKTEENIALLESLLHNSNVNVRIEAWRVLDGWKIQGIPSWREMQQ